MHFTNEWSLKLLAQIESQNVRNKLINPDKLINIEKIKKALYMCVEAHKNQKRQTGDPYYSHPITIALRLSMYGFNENIIIIALLHDIIEDTEVTYLMIKDWFCEEIADGVRLLTRKKDKEKKSMEELIKNLWKVKRNDLFFIKIFDRIHNMETIYCKSQAKQLHEAIETLSLLCPIASFLGDGFFTQYLAKLCQEITDFSHF